MDSPIVGAILSGANLWVFRNLPQDFPARLARYLLSTLGWAVILALAAPVVTRVGRGAWDRAEWLRRWLASDIIWYNADNDDGVSAWAGRLRLGRSS
jgi:transglutaminase-like putative cysteine protease